MNFKMSEEIDKKRDEQVDGRFWPLVLAGLTGGSAVGFVPFVIEFGKNATEDATQAWLSSTSQQTFFFIMLGLVACVIFYGAWSVAQQRKGGEAKSLEDDPLGVGTKADNEPMDEHSNSSPPHWIMFMWAAVLGLIGVGLLVGWLTGYKLPAEVNQRKKPGIEQIKFAVEQELLRSAKPNPSVDKWFKRASEQSPDKP